MVDICRLSIRYALKIALDIYTIEGDFHSETLESLRVFIYIII